MRNFLLKNKIKTKWPRLSDSVPLTSYDSNVLQNIMNTILEQWIWINIMSCLIDNDLLNHVAIGSKAFQLI